MSMHTCLQCQKIFEFQWRSKTDRPGAYCSSECYQKTRQAKKEAFGAVSKACEQCGTLFYPIPGRQPVEFRKKRFCSRECRGLARRNTIDDLLERISPNANGCHIWTGMTTNNNYGLTRLNNRWVMAHRAVWEHYRGPILEGLQIDHMCGSRLCCNVDHLRVVTPRENTLSELTNTTAALHRRKTHCPLCGSEYTVSSDGHRYCKPCNRRNQTAYQRRYRAAKRKAKGD
jgi:hypothetical protein